MYWKGRIRLVHQYRLNGYNIVLDVHSGGIHVVDDMVYELIQLYNEEKTSDEILQTLRESYDEFSIKEGIKEIEELRREKLLFTEDMYENVAASFGQRQPVVKALCLHIAHDCNLSCKYCFAGEGEYGGDRSIMNFEVGKKAIDFLLKNSGNRKNLEVDFFGGEPLLNFEVVKKIVQYARAQEEKYNKNFRFTITTNGLLLDNAKQEFINEHMHNVVLSLDGRKEIHDEMRPTPNGKGSYDLIVDKFLQMAESRGSKDYYVRGTYTRQNLDFSKDVLHLADLGFDRISVEPVVAAENFSYAIQKKDLDVLLKEYEILAQELIKRKKQGKPLTFFHFMLDLHQGPCIIKRLSGCGAGCEYLAVTPQGDLYPCHQFVGNKDFLMGNIDEGILNQERYEEFVQCNVYAKDQCKDCWAKFYCSGGCGANAYQFHGDIHKVYEVGCELEKKRVECAIMMQVASMDV